MLSCSNILYIDRPIYINSHRFHACSYQNSLHFKKWKISYFFLNFKFIETKTKQKLSRVTVSFPFHLLILFRSYSQRYFVIIIITRGNIYLMRGGGGRLLFYRTRDESVTVATIDRFCCVRKRWLECCCWPFFFIRSIEEMIPMGLISFILSYAGRRRYSAAHSFDIFSFLFVL
jgi:hypothetical protein